MPKIARRVQPFGTTIFTEINQLASQYNAINMGQGKPDFDGPNEIIEVFMNALQSGQYNQYAPAKGIPEFRQGLVKHAGRYNLDVDVEHGVMVTPGATEAIFAAVMGLVDAGDEVIIIQPFFDSYAPSVLMAGATPVYISLHAPDWTFDEAELRKAFNPKTRAIIINTPHNPTGKVFTLNELTLIADLAKEFDVTVISDEVYEHLIYHPAQHIPIASLPDMFERTVTIGSAGKTFGMTGWKLGWLYGHPELIRGVWQAHQFIVFATNHPTQVAVAHAFNHFDDSYYATYRALYTAKRQRTLDGLTQAGIRFAEPMGTYFVMADFSAVFDGNDTEFAKYLIQEIGVAAIPPSAFYQESDKHLAKNYARFSFAKHDDQLDEAINRMQRLKP